MRSDRRWFADPRHLLGLPTVAVVGAKVRSCTSLLIVPGTMLPPSASFATLAVVPPVVVKVNAVSEMFCEPSPLR